MTVLVIALIVALVVISVISAILVTRSLQAMRDTAEQSGNQMAAMVSHMTTLASGMNKSNTEAVSAAVAGAIEGTVQLLAPVREVTTKETSVANPVDLWSATNDVDPSAADWSASDPWLDPDRDPSFVGGISVGEELIAGVPRPDLAGEDL